MEQQVIAAARALVAVIAAAREFDKATAAQTRTPKSKVNFEVQHLRHLRQGLRRGQGVSYQGRLVIRHSLKVDSSMHAIN